MVKRKSYFQGLSREMLFMMYGGFFGALFGVFVTTKMSLNTFFMYLVISIIILNLLIFFIDFVWPRIINKI